MTPSVTIDHVVAARTALHGHAVRTPLVRNPGLDSAVGGRLFIKAENLQRTGSFKFRGAMNALSSLSSDQLRSGVITFSSGNHALAIAEAAQILGCPAVILMPDDAPHIKSAGVRARKAEVVTYGRDSDDREALAADLVRSRGLHLIHPYDDPLVIAGQGTAALEAIEQLNDQYSVARIDQIVVCCSGGGLAAGWSTAIGDALGRPSFVIVEPEGFDDTSRSLVSGTKEINERASGTICDALVVRSPGTLTLPILAQRGARGATVSDAEVFAAMRFAAITLKLVLEPSGASPLASVLSNKVEAAGRSTLLIASGGNVDPDVFTRSMMAGA